jgi:hypothetical protein
LHIVSISYVIESPAILDSWIILAAALTYRRFSPDAFYSPVLPEVTQSFAIIFIAEFFSTSAVTDSEWISVFLPSSVMLLAPPVRMVGSAAYVASVHGRRGRSIDHGRR